MTIGCMMRVKSLSITRWRKSTRGSKLEEDREMMLSFSSCSSLFSGIFSSLTRSGNVAPPSRAWQRVKKRSRWLSWYKKRMICYSGLFVDKKQQRDKERDRQSACNAPGEDVRQKQSGHLLYYVCVCALIFSLPLCMRGRTSEKVTCNASFQPLLTCVCTEDTACTSRLNSPLWLSIHLTGGTWGGSFYTTKRKTENVTVCGFLCLCSVLNMSIFIEE